VPKLLVAVAGCLALLGLTPLAAHSAARTAPTHAVSVTGTGVAMYPAFTPSIHRYGITTTTDTKGTVTLTASTTDPNGTTWVDGQPIAGGTTTLTGLATGDEISVFIKDSGGTAVYSLIYLPAAFPTMTVTAKQPGIAPGDVFLTPTNFQKPSFETIVDNNGVPIYVRTDGGVPLDFKLQPNGDYSVARSPGAPGQANSDQIIELNSKFKQVGAFHTDGDLTNTDGHDSILLANGDRWLIATQPRTTAPSAPWDAVIQEQSPSGKVLFEWSTADHVSQALDSVLPDNPDYAHINSIWLMKNGDILASFRHLDQVMEIATSAHNGFKSGDIVWSLGGRRPTLTTVNDPEDGPCAQHDATQLPNGNILMFDDGSESIDGSALLCVGPTSPVPPAITVARPQSRVAEYRINQAAKTATLVWSYQVTNRDSNFEGSAQRLANGDTLVGWGSVTTTLATEVNPAGQTLWELSDNTGLFSYRALRFPAPDKTPPAVTVTTPASGATYTFGQKVASNFSCTDKGGSSLQTCNGPVTEGASIDTSSSGLHTFSVVATDGAGNTTTVKRTYHVVGSPYRPDATIKAPGGKLVGGAVYGGISKQQVHESISHPGASVHATIGLRNRGSVADRIVLSGSAGTSKFTVKYFVGKTNITKRVTAGTYRTPSLAPGERFSLSVTITRTTHAKHGNTKQVKMSARSIHDSGAVDSVATIVKATR
jgi:hypothetical protein